MPGSVAKRGAIPHPGPVGIRRGIAPANPQDRSASGSPGIGAGAGWPYVPFNASSYTAPMLITIRTMTTMIISPTIA